MRRQIEQTNSQALLITYCKLQILNHLTLSLSMPSIHLTTFIAAPVNLVFDLARSIDLHKASMEASKERAVAGTTSGLINENETVTWEAKHFFKLRQLTSKITSMKSPDSFVDEMIKGDFKSYRHEHHFKVIENGTIMIDLIEFETPYGSLGRLVNRFYMIAYMEKLIKERNNTIKEYAESEKGKTILSGKR